MEVCLSMKLKLQFCLFVTEMMIRRLCSDWMTTMSMMMMMTGFSTGPACRTGDPESFFGDHTSYCKSYRRGNNVNHNDNVHYYQRYHHA